jgi:hypothetical protein
VSINLTVKATAYVASGEIDPLVHVYKKWDAYQVALFHPHAFNALDEDILLELCDWCYRKILLLHHPASKPKRQAQLSLQFNF